jgi:hypothetical protein
MNKRSPFNYVAQIERVQKWITANPGLHVNEMLDEMSDTPRGTLSSLMSHMFSAGHLLRPSKGFYALPELVASPRSVAYDIKKLKKSPNIFRTIKNRTAKPKGVLPELPRNAPVENEEIRKNTSLFTEPKTPFKDINRVSSFPIVTNNEEYARKSLEEFNRNQAIMSAVDVLKSYGVKVTLEF